MFVMSGEQDVAKKLKSTTWHKELLLEILKKLKTDVTHICAHLYLILRFLSEMDK